MTFPYLEKIPYRAQLQARVKKLNEYEKYSTPFRKGPYVFFRKNAGLQNQSVLYIQKGQNGAPEVLIDPNTLVGGWDRAARCLRAVQGCEVRGLRDLPQRLGLAGIQSDGARDEEDAGRQPRMGEGVGRGLAGRRLLLQPVSGAREGAGEGLHQREPPGLLSPRRHAAVRRRRGLFGRREPPALSHCRDDRGRAVCAAVDLGSGEGQGWQFPVRPRSVEGGA